MHPSLTSLPEELVRQIALQPSCSILDIVSLAGTSRYLRSIVKTNSIGHEFLRRDAGNLQVEVTISTHITGLDEFDFGWVKGWATHPPVRKADGQEGRGAVFVHQAQSDASHVWIITLWPSGRAAMRHERFSTPMVCNHPHLDRIRQPGTSLPIGPRHRITCSQCSTLYTTRLTYHIDKRYLVFFQNWEDKYQFHPLPEADIREARITTKLVNSFVGVGWAVQDLAPTVSVQRYGMAQSPAKAGNIEAFFGITYDSIEYDSIEKEEGEVLDRGMENLSVAGPADADASRSYTNPWL